MVKVRLRPRTLLIGSVALLGSFAPGVGRAAPTQTAYAGGTLLSVQGSQVHGAVALVSAMGQLRVYVSATGLAPGAVSTAQIRSGLCGSNGPVRLSLTRLTADAHGQASALTTLPGTKIQAMGWSLVVRASASGATTTACGNLWGPDLTFPLAASGTSAAHGEAIVLGNMDTRGGMAKRDAGAVVVTFVQGLGARTTSTEQLQQGHCTALGKSVSKLSDLAADGTGTAVATTFLPAMNAVMAGGIALSVRGSASSSLACGNDPGRPMAGSM